MNSRLRLVPPKQRLAQISGSRICAMRVPSGANTWTPSYPSPTQPADDHTFPSSSQRMPSAKPVLPSQVRSEEHTSELQSLMRISYAVFCLKKKNKKYRSINESIISHIL